MSDLTHPLLPGIRCPGLHNPNWPRTLHDGQLTGFSPLTCSMTEAPSVWTTLDVGGEVDWIKTVTLSDGESCLLVCDNRLRRVSHSGNVLWSSSVAGELCFFGDLCGNGRDVILLGRGPRVTLLDAATGETQWTHCFDPPHVHVRVAVGNVLPDRPGLEAAVFLAYGDEGCLIHFPPEGEPQFVWKRTVVVPEEWPERYDHGCHIKLDLSEPDEPVIWNVRHHRCRGFHARTGKMASSLVYSIGNGHLRNYGPWEFGRDKHGNPMICVVAERVQEHVHAIRLRREGENELAWQHYYGELYNVPGVAVEHLSVTDLDGDGETEIAYNVRDPERGFRSFVRVRGAGDGTVKAEVEDAWCVGVWTAPDGKPALLVLSAPDGATPVHGDLTVYRFGPSGDLVPLATFEQAGAWGVIAAGDHLLLRRTGPKSVVSLVRYGLRHGALYEAARTDAHSLLENPIHTIVEDADEEIFIVPGKEGSLHALRWDGTPVWELELEGGAAPVLSATDLTGDGCAELVATTAGNRVRVFSLEDRDVFKEIANHEFLGARHRHSPLLHDLEGTGGHCLIVPGSTPQGELAVRAYRGDGSLFWETSLGVSTAQNGQAIAWNAGAFLPGPRAGVAVSVNNTLRNIEGTYLLDGLNGNLLWHRGIHREGDHLRPYIPHGIPTAFDIDGNGLDEIGMDMLSYMAFLRGTDGGFFFLNPTKNLGEKGALYAGNLYNSYVPVYQTEKDKKPHWFVPVGGYGSFGLMKPDPREGIWREDPGYDVPPKIGLIDVDGDGVLEVGYALLNHSTFICRNLWTGDVKWELDLPEAPNSPVMVADVDGDGKGEFLVGSYCIGTDVDGNGEIRWKSPVSMGWAIFADFDGDGTGEIACASQGKIHILKAD